MRIKCTDILLLLLQIYRANYEFRLCMLLVQFSVEEKWLTW
jgi:hypothetical protein